MISSRSLDELHPKVAALARAFIVHAMSQGIELVVICTYRDAEAQDALFAQGRTVPGHIVTNARGGDSFHQWRVAFDAIPIVNGKAVWDANDPVWPRVGRLAQALDLECGMFWKHFPDVDHFQKTYGLTISDFKAGKTIPEDT